MGTAQRNNRLFFGLLALLSICLGVVCLMAFTTGGALALRRAASSRSATEGPTGVTQLRNSTPNHNDHPQFLSKLNGDYSI